MKRGACAQMLFRDECYQMHGIFDENGKSVAPNWNFGANETKTQQQNVRKMNRKQYARVAMPA